MTHTSHQRAISRSKMRDLLADASRAVAEIAYLLGFSEPTAFHRAFKRWTGLPPMEFRQRRRQGG